MIGMIWAQTENGVIGADGGMPWHQATDLKFYHLITRQGDVVLGRKTHEINGKAQAGRRTIVLTSNTDYEDPDPRVQIAHSKEEVLDLIKESDSPVFISGGAGIYRQFADEATHIYRTLIHTEVKGDTFAPEIDYSLFERVWTYEGEADASNDHSYTIEIYKRKDLMDYSHGE